MYVTPWTTFLQALSSFLPNNPPHRPMDEVPLHSSHPTIVRSRRPLPASFQQQLNTFEFLSNIPAATE